jgi:hypothetical protein
VANEVDKIDSLLMQEHQWAEKDSPFRGETFTYCTHCGHLRYDMDVPSHCPGKVPVHGF